MRYLIENVNADSSCGDEHGDTPFHLAAQFGHLSVVKKLVEDYMCDPGVTNGDGLTPADWACVKGHIRITSYLSSIAKTVSSECDYYSVIAQHALQGEKAPLACVS